MHKTPVRLAGALALSLFLAPGLALADDDREVEGVVESIDAAARTLVVSGVTIHTDDRTDYDDDYSRFADIRVGDRIEVDYVVRDGVRVAKEIERDD